MSAPEVLKKLDLLRCPHCRTGAGSGENLFCPACAAELPLFSGARCPGCGGPLDGVLARCGKCLREKSRSYLDAVALMEYRGAGRELVLSLKNGRVELARPFGRMLADAVRARHWPLDAVSAVPLHWAREWRRTYNQSELLAEIVRGELALPRLGMKRVRRTADQKQLNAEERRRNLEDAFFAPPEKCRGRIVLLVDDVLTTGTTLHAAASALKQAGAAAVYACIIARA